MNKFMRPMEHSPVKAMHLLKSQQQNLMEQLGLNGKFNMLTLSYMHCADNLLS